MTAEVFVDYYEVLQISPHADPDTIHRVYRILAQRFHPDNKETGDRETFQQIMEAYRALSDPESRAAFDVKHRGERRLSWKIFNQPQAAQGMEGEKRKRQGVLAVLYRKRMAQPDQPTMTLRELEDLLGVPKEHLEFTLWYLKEGQFVTRGDNGRMAITIRGVDLAEELAAKRPESQPLLNAPAFVA